MANQQRQHGGLAGLNGCAWIVLIGLGILGLACVVNCVLPSMIVIIRDL